MPRIVNASVDGEPFRVIAYSGYQAEQEPRALIVVGERLDVVAIDERWVEPDARYFRVRTRGGRRHLLRYDLSAFAWERR